MHVYSVRRLNQQDTDILCLLNHRQLTTLDFDTNFGLDVRLPLGYAVEPVDSYGDILYGNFKNIAYDYGTPYFISYPSSTGKSYWEESIGYVWYQKELIYQSKWWPMFRYVRRYVQKELGINSDCRCIYIPIDDVLLRAIMEPEIIAYDLDDSLFMPDGYRDWKRSDWVSHNSLWRNLTYPKGTDLYFLAT